MRVLTLHCVLGEFPSFEAEETDLNKAKIKHTYNQKTLNHL